MLYPQHHHITFELQLIEVSSPCPSVKEEQTSHLLFYSLVLLMWAVSNNAVLFAIRIADCSLLSSQSWRAMWVISQMWDVLGLSARTYMFFLWLNSLGSTTAPLYRPKSVPFSVTVCQSNCSPVQFCCTQYGKAREVCIQFMGALTSYRSGGTKCGSGCISAVHHGVSNRLCVSERYKVIVGNRVCLITGTDRV